jgi:hypothetical protein
MCEQSHQREEVVPCLLITTLYDDTICSGYVGDDVLMIMSMMSMMQMRITVY